MYTYFFLNFFRRSTLQNMADSDDEYDRKRRDKFRGERTESYSRERRDDRRRDDWVDRYTYFSFCFTHNDKKNSCFLFFSFIVDMFIYLI